MRAKLSRFLPIVFILQFNLSVAQDADTLAKVMFLALGDVNLGRHVGQQILKGNIDFPFEKFGNVLTRADEIFANLECPVTDQNGETQSPKSNLIFCAPPEASASLRRAGISVVSTANNHAYDYGLKGIRETIKFLKRDNIRFTGTIADTAEYFKPVIIERDSIRIGIVAYTQTVNLIRGTRSGLISLFDSARAKCDIDSLKPSVDFVLASYHGGDEYKDVPSRSASRQMDLLAAFGADIIIGHHPHVPQGIRTSGGCLIFNSLGNAVFMQPQKYWTQRSFALLIGFAARNGRKEISSIELIPFRPGYQLQTNLSPEESEELIDHIQKLSTVTITKNERGYFVKLSDEK